MVNVCCCFSPELCDVVIVAVGGVEFPCHKCVLIARLGELCFFCYRTSVINIAKCLLLTTARKGQCKTKYPCSIFCRCFVIRLIKSTANMFSVTASLTHKAKFILTKALKSSNDLVAFLYSP